MVGLPKEQYIEADFVILIISSRSRFNVNSRPLIIKIVPL